jgi:hypothetical protein
VNTDVIYKSGAEDNPTCLDQRGTRLLVDYVTE